MNDCGANISPSRTSLCPYQFAHKSMVVVKTYRLLEDACESQTKVFTFTTEIAMIGDSNGSKATECHAVMLNKTQWCERCSTNADVNGDGFGP